MESASFQVAVIAVAEEVVRNVGDCCYFSQKTIML